MYPISVLVFDSGFGGLTIVRKIRDLTPGIRIIYLSDNAVFPYGMLTEQALKDRVKNVLCQVISIEVPDLIVIACNTASTAAIDYLRDVFHIPFVGVVPAIKPAAEITKTSVIGVLATCLTIRGDYLDKLILSYANGCEVIKHGSSVLVDQAEKKMKGVSLDLKLIKEEVRFLIDRVNASNLDVLVLGCTHFLLIREEISMFVEKNIRLIDSGEAVANRVNSILLQNNNLSLEVEGRTKSHPSKFYTTSVNCMSDTVFINVKEFLGKDTERQLLNL